MSIVPEAGLSSGLQRAEAPIVLIEPFQVVTLSFGYAGLILFAEAAAAITLTTIVLITSTGLRTPREAAAGQLGTDVSARPKPSLPLRQTLQDRPPPS